MNSFVETLSPAARNHAEARIDYYADLSQAVLRSLRQLAEVNVQFSREWLNDSTAAWRNSLLTASSERSASVPSPESIGQRLQQYHQQLAQVASDFQHSLTQVAQEHVPETTRTATELASAGQKAAGQHLSDEANRFANIATQNKAMPQAASMQSSDEGNRG